MSRRPSRRTIISMAVLMVATLASATYVVATRDAGELGTAQGDRGARAQTKAEALARAKALPLSTIEVDRSLTPMTPQLPALDGAPRPVDTVTDATGLQADFIRNELIVTTEDRSEAEEIARRWNGRIIATNQASPELGVPPSFLLRVDTSRADTEALPRNLRAVVPGVRSDLRVSSPAGLRLLAASAAEAATGASVSANFVTRSASIASGTTREAPRGVTDGANITDYNRDAFTWKHINLEDPHGFGVPEAWRLLALSDHLERDITFAVLDRGFKLNRDFPPDTVSLVSGAGGPYSPNYEAGKEWHGTNVTVAGAGVPDNGFGSAGPAGPVADVTTIYVPGDLFTLVGALLVTKSYDVDIVNMSFGIPLPASLAWPALALSPLTSSMRETGTLLFAAAGNDGDDIDAEDCVFVVGPIPGEVCWESTFVSPCENAAVICVGGMDRDTTGRAKGSNYGLDDVDIYGPHFHRLGADSVPDENRTIEWQAGTSYASPFVAGIAALIWAADPAMSAGTVARLLLSWSREGEGVVGRYAHAYEAVLAVVRDELRPYVEITVPDHGAEVEAAQFGGLPLRAFAEDYRDQPCCTIWWRSDVDGNLGKGKTLEAFLSVGTHTITAVAHELDGDVSNPDSVTVTVRNAAPSVTIEAPGATDDVYVGIPIQLRGEGRDPNGLDGRLPCSSLTWTSSNPDDTAFPLTGCQPNATFPTPGSRTLTLTGSDPHGARDSASVSITVTQPPENAPPEVFIDSPADGSAYYASDSIELEGRATDPDGEGSLSYEWRARFEGGGERVLGTSEDMTWTPGENTVGCTDDYEVELIFTARDSDGESEPASVKIEVRCPPA